MFEWDGFEFHGQFPTECQEKSIPPSLKTLVAMLLNGPNASHHDATVSQACLTISQLVYFNAKDKTSVTTKPRHCNAREPPLPLYIAINSHTQTRSKQMVSTWHKLGLSISYKRVVEVENKVASSVCKCFIEEGIVCPGPQRKHIFTVGALDDIDHNPSSTTVVGSFH